ncbi:ribokinase [Dyadobacter arcticus]|uniref:Ribokinase n=1 Tax=Dyadobacter arcticus TaxID=1078754 RepID=A0ABX0ULD2_9BACT|nr:ribokinase [Dyadobacter arcticus]NIJ53771.1 ribokinase [Dyadobacter arcticus]
MIYVVGSSNTDMVVKSERLPAKGETIIGGEFLMNPGGKGANQAVSAARLGGNVTFVCRVGDDLFGNAALHQFRNENINTDFVTTDPTLPSGVALINVDVNGENAISVAPGANNALLTEHVIPALENITSEDILLIQLEIPLATVVFAVKYASNKGAKVILNPAPARVLPKEIYQHLYLITPNETEMQMLTGIEFVDKKSIRQAADQLFNYGCKNVIITLGVMGAFFKTREKSQFIKATRVIQADSTGAGDCYNGAIALSISEGNTLEEAAIFASKAAAVSITRMGAQSSAPTKKEIADYFNR